MRMKETKVWKERVWEERQSMELQITFDEIRSHAVLTVGEFLISHWAPSERGDTST